MISTHPEHPATYIERVRLQTVYGRARKVINVVFVLALVATLIFSAYLEINALGMAIKPEGSILPALGFPIVAIAEVYFLIFLKSVGVAYFDAVDVLIESHRNKNDR